MTLKAKKLEKKQANAFVYLLDRGFNPYAVCPRPPGDEDDVRLIPTCRDAEGSQQRERNGVSPGKNAEAKKFRRNFIPVLSYGHEHGMAEGKKLAGLPSRPRIAPTAG